MMKPKGFSKVILSRLTCPWEEFTNLDLNIKE